MNLLKELITITPVTEGAIKDLHIDLLNAIENEFDTDDGMTQKIADWLLNNTDDKDVDEFLYDHFHDQMPYGTQKTRDGDPSNWVADHMSQIFAKELRPLWQAERESKKLKEDWGSSDWSILLSYVDRDIDGGMSVEDAVQHMADSYYHHMGYDSADEAVDAIMHMAGLRKKHWATGKDTNWPKLIAQTDEYRAELDEDRQVHIMDGEGTMRLSMPMKAFRAFVKEAAKNVDAHAG